MPEVANLYGGFQQRQSKGVAWHRGLRPYLALAAVLFALGVSLGSLAVARMGEAQVNELNIYIIDFVKNISSISPNHHANAVAAMLENATVILLIYLLGLTVIGIPLTLSIIFMRGFYLGFSVGFLCQGLNSGGILLTMVSILPQNIFFIPGLLVAVSASLLFSTQLLQRFYNSKFKILPSFIKYTLIMGAITLVILVAAAVQAYITPWLVMQSSGLLMKIYSGQWPGYF